MSRIFLAHPSGYEDIPALVEKLRRALPAAAQGLEIIPGADDYARNFVRFTNWDGWTLSVAAGVEYQGGLQTPRFTSIIVAPTLFVGRATKAIVAQALGRKPIYYFDGMSTLAQVLGINVVDETDYKNGWQLITPMPEGSW